MNAKIGSLLVGAGFLLGTVGVKALTSPQAKKCYVHGVAGALRAKQSYEEIVEQAKAEVDDIVAEAAYLNASKPDHTQSAAEAVAAETADASAATSASTATTTA